MKKNNIILTGMPGSGKSYIGLKLSEVLSGFTLFDTDGIIEKTQGMKISEIFSKYSEDYFRKLEYDTIKMLCTGDKKIISTGGGAFENPDTRNTLLNFGTVYYLKSDIDVLYYRIAKENTRPLLNKENPKAELENILKRREQNYLKADYVVSTTDMTEEEVIGFIAGSIDETDSSCRR